MVNSISQRQILFSLAGSVIPEYLHSLDAKLRQHLELALYLMHTYPLLC